MSAALPRRTLLREADGILREAGAQRVVTIDELLDGLRSGQRFRVRRSSTGVDCTGQVLAEVLGAAFFGGRGSAATGQPLDLFEPFRRCLSTQER